MRRSDRHGRINESAPLSSALSRRALKRARRTAVACRRRSLLLAAIATCTCSRTAAYRQLRSPWWQRRRANTSRKTPSGRFKTPPAGARERPGLKKGFAGPRQCARVGSAVRHDTLLHLLCTYQMSPLPSSCSAVAHRIPFSRRLELVDKAHTHTYIYIYINRAGDFATDVHSPHDRISKRGISHVQLMRLGEPASRVFHSRFDYEMAPFTCGDVN